MSYNRENYRRIKAAFAEKPLDAMKRADERRQELWQRVPGVFELDRELSNTGLAVLATASEGVAGLEERISAIKAKNLELQAKRAALLSAAGYPADYSELRYECEKCCDTGYLNGKLCDCMKRELTLAGYESSGIGALIGRQTFENFSLSYYSEKDAPTMGYVFERVKDFAEGFSPKSRSLLFMGGTGLGKTHLSTASAKVIIDSGYDVVYETAQNVFSDFEARRFGSRDSDLPDTDRYFDCDLLILDDLGTEMGNNFTVSCLYNIINTRQNRSLPMIISTNLDQNEIRRRYGDRITSRLLGEFLPLLFVGGDVRAAKLRERK